MPDTLCRDDTLAWSERQAALLRRLATGERVNAGIGWPNVIEEIEDVGKSELRAVESLLALDHLITTDTRLPDTTALLAMLIPSP